MARFIPQNAAILSLEDRPKFTRARFKYPCAAGGLPPRRRRSERDVVVLAAARRAAAATAAAAATIGVVVVLGSRVAAAAAAAAARCAAEHLEVVADDLGAVALLAARLVVPGAGLDASFDEDLL